MKRKLPSLLGSYSRMLLPRRGLGRGERLPNLAMDSRSLRFDARHLRAYRQHFGLDPGLGVPLLYPQVISLPLHLRLLSRSRMPLSILGLIHLRSHIQRYRMLDEDAQLQLDCRILTSRRSPLGLEVDVATEVWHHDMLYWQSITTYLRRGDFARIGDDFANASIPLAFEKSLHGSLTRRPSSRPATIGRTRGSVTTPPESPS